MQKSILPPALLTHAMNAEIKKINTSAIRTVKKQLKESFLHRLFFGLQTQQIKNRVPQDLPWNDPDAYSSYE